MKFGQLIEYNFSKNHTQSVVENIISDPFLKTENWASLWSILQSFIYFVFIVWQVEDYRKWLKLSWRPLVFTSYKAFLKNKKRSGTSLPASFMPGENASGC